MNIRLLFVVVGFVYGSQVLADNQDPDKANSSASNNTKPYEIVITPTVTKSDLRGLIQEVESDFFDRFNELNIDDSFDIVCYKMTPPMTHISQRVCEPLFLIQLRSQNASDSTYTLGTQYATGPFGAAVGSGMPPVIMNPEALRRETSESFKLLQENMEELNRTDNELRSIGSALAQLKARLEKFGKED
ncbi:MAG: hypothetical protein COA96_16405 [SAR86 cluster bacterium]|uniref:Uncharacterized protein n=1 Tax=SAR86 cluster bacterium TaxID=2030880 RepID=A0A2A5AJM7_9GAMM|nr:MAG: hypothetical protein COA96_16405 [SAR86 cluster bacterium]